MQTKSDRRVVVIGGGTGSSVLLRSLKQYTQNITSIVTVADDGGSTGTMRSAMGILAPGDIRNCLVALADEENAMAALMDVRFTENFLKKQSVGNIMIAAMTKVCGSFAEAVKKLGEVLAIKGTVLPVTTANINLSATLSNGKVLKGESKIPKYCAKNKLHIDTMHLVPCDAEALPDCLSAIRQADIIVLSAGSLYTSLVPNLLVRGICEALSSAKAHKYYLCNIMTEYGETEGYTLSEHVHALIKHAEGKRIFDTVLYNTAQIPQNICARYLKENAEPVKTFIEPGLKSEYEFCGMDLAKLSDDVVRHDSDAFWKYVFQSAADEAFAT